MKQPVGNQLVTQIRLSTGPDKMVSFLPVSLHFQLLVSTGKLQMARNELMSASSPRRLANQTVYACFVVTFHI